MNAVILEMSEEAEEQDPDAPGNFVIFLVDEEGFIKSKEGKYLLPADVREQGSFARLVADDAAQNR